MSLTSKVKIYRYKGKGFEICEDTVVRETPVTLFVNDEELVTMVCTPDSLKELAVGFLCSEGILSHENNLKDIKINLNEGLIWVDTANPVPATENFLRRYITTCCGKGRASFYFVNDARGMKPLEPGRLNITIENIIKLSAMLEERAQLFKKTGGAHGAALCLPEEVLALYEDIGRHNAVDKILGHSFLNEISLTDKVIVISGRVSSEILIKVARMGIPMIISRSAPTELALQMAGELGVTIVGFARGSRLNLYTHPERVVT